MKTKTMSFRNESLGLDATNVSKDILFQEIATNFYTQPNPEDPKGPKTCLDTQRMVLIGKDGEEMVAGYQDAASLQDFKAAYEMSLKTAICKSEYIQFTDGDTTVIWVQKAEMYAKYGWLPVSAKSVEEPATEPEVPENVEEPVVEPEADMAAGSEDTDEVVV